MKLTRVVAFFVMAAGIGINALDAKTLRNVDGPAEYPPVSFTGNQYVDSKGCVFIRAGIDGNVTWVPRVARSRQQVCGAQPSLSGAQMAGAKAAPVNAAVMLPDPDPSVPDAKPAPVAKVKPALVQQQPRVVAKPAPRPAPLTLRQPMKTVASVTTPPRIGLAAQPVAPRRIAVPQTLQAPAAKRPAPVVPGARVAAAPLGAGCAGLSPYARQSLAGVRGVRCGPQAAAPISGGYDGAVRAVSGMRGMPQAITPQTRVAPRHVYEMQQQSADVGIVPDGYRRAWADDRLNPKRAHQTLEGRAMMDQRWTRTVPRQLKPANTGRSGFNPDAANVVTRNNPFYADNRGLAVRTVPQTEAPVYTGAQAVGSAKGNAYVSSKSVRKAAPVAQSKAAAAKPNRATPKPVSAPAGHRYVQVGAFATESGARNAIARLHGAGLPVRKKSVTKDGKQLQVIVTGPYRTSAELGKALGRARSAGFKTAFTH